MEKQTNNELQNIYFLPFLMAFLQFCFLFVALIASAFFFEQRVLLIGGFCVCVWCFFFIRSVIKGRVIRKNVYNFLLIILFIFVCFCIIRQSWFSHYLRVDAVERFFEGKTFIDTLYHSAIAESIVTNGYPSIQQNAPTFLTYHCFSHWIIASISKVLGIPCYIAYNYLFPILFIPLFLFLVQKVASIGKKYFIGESSLSFCDYIILMGFICGFFTKRFQKNIGCNIYMGLYNSESCLIAIIITLLYFLIIYVGYKKIKQFENINILLFIPLFVLILSYTKISFGIIFALGAGYYFFRKYCFKNIKCISFVGYILVFALYYLLTKKLSTSYPVTNTDSNLIQLFSYPRLYCKNIFYILLHYIFLLFPIVIVINSKKESFFNNIFSYKKECIFVEMCLLLMIAACTPGLLLNIRGGSAFYFVIPVYAFSWLLFISSGAESIMSVFFITLFSKKQIIFKESFFVVIIMMIVSSAFFRDIHLYNSIVQTLRSRISLVGFRKDIPKNVKELFMPVKILEDNNYKLFNQMRSVVSTAPRDYCLFFSDGSDFIRKYDYYFSKSTLERISLCNPNFATSAYIGIPILNSMYEKEGIFYRGDDRIFGPYKAFTSYSMPPPLCKDKVTEDNMINRAREIGKKHIIVLNKYDYYIIDIN